MPLTSNAVRDAAATRAFAKDRALQGAKDSYWRGGGDYYYELTPEGIKVTGGDTGGKLRDGASTLLAWDDPNSKNIIDAILAEQGTQDTELGVRYEATEPEPRRIEMEPMQITASPTESRPPGEATSQASTDSVSEGEPAPADEGLRAAPVRGAPDPQNWRPPATPGQKRDAIKAAMRQGVSSGDVQHDARGHQILYDTKTNSFRYGSQAEVDANVDLDKVRGGSY